MAYRLEQGNAAKVWQLCEKPNADSVFVWRLTVIACCMQMSKSPCNLSSPGFAAMLSAAVNSSSVREDGQHCAEQAREALQDTLRGLPANKQIDLRVLKEAYDSSIREAAAADAAVAAVAKVCSHSVGSRLYICRSQLA